MCGPFVLAQTSDRLARIPISALCEAHRLRAAMLLPYHAGRVTSYAGLGALAAWFSGSAGRIAALPTLSALLLLLAAGIFLTQAMGRLLPAFRGVGLSPPVVWSARLAAFANRLGRYRDHPAGGYLLGLVLGLLPCGLLYGALAAAAASPNAAAGALAMAGFALGTVPGLVAVAIAGYAAGQRFRAASIAAAPFLLLLNATVLAALGVSRLLNMA